jgi:cyclophilin family peptidyl-prolyl cis-trans isomerase
MWRVIVALMLLLPALATTLPTASGQDGKTINLQIIVDQSGSMAAATDTGPLRIEAAKTVLNEVIAQIPEDEGVNVGLRVYGHRGNNQPPGQAESCVSSDLLVPMQGVDKAGLTTQVNALQPIGWTPLGYALEQAANDFTEPASENVVNAIIMVTDGLETCGGDPAAVAAELQNSPAGITTHVIGFGTAPEELAILEGITQNGGGQLLDSNNAAQLMAALFEILEDLDVVEESGSGEARNSPLGIGRVGRSGDYEISVISVTPNANDIVMAENQFNDPPGEGEQFLIARVAVTYVGDETGTPWLDNEYQAVGNSSVGYTTFNNSCGVIPDDPFTISELFPGGSVEFNVCWRIQASDADSLVMYVEPLMDFDAKPFWFSLGNPIDVIVDPDASPEASTDSAPEPTATQISSSAAASDQVSTRENPLPLNTTGKVGDFEVTVVSSTPNANDVVMAENQFNDPPSAGNQFFITRVRVTYVGNETGSPGFDLEYQAVGAASKGYTTYNDYCGVYPDEPYTVSELFPGGTAEFNLCWQIESSDQDSLVMYIESWMDFNSEPVWFAVQP